MPVLYRRRQRGTLILAVLGAGAVAFAAALTGGSLPVAAWPTAAVILVVALLFGSLTVEVAQDEVRLWFGVGLVRRRIALGDVVGAQAVRNSWTSGWGIRWIPGGWLYNVSGLDAVELQFVHGGVVRIGTDQPRELERAIRAAQGR